VRTVGDSTDGHGRGTPAACFGWTCTVESVSTDASASAFMTCRPSATVCRCRLETLGQMSFAVPRRIGATPRRTGPRRPVTGPAGTRVPSIGVGPRAATLALTSPARVPAGQRVNVPEMYLCMRRVPSTDLGIRALQLRRREPRSPRYRPGAGDLGTRWPHCSAARPVRCRSGQAGWPWPGMPGDGWLRRSCSWARTTKSSQLFANVSNAGDSTAW
jgi:hypothetical protein